MCNEKVLWYVRQLQLLRHGFINEIENIDAIEHHVINFEDGMEKAMEAVCGVYTELVGIEVQKGKEVKHV